jgi:hemolysin type calcium-binding protein
MSSRPARRRMLATFVVLAALLAGATTLHAAIGGEPAAPASGLRVSADGSMSISNSKEGAAIFTLANLGPGDSGQGEVTIANTGTLPGTLALASFDRSDAPGTYGGALSERLTLRVEELSSGAASAVYDGQLGAMPELQLGSLGTGESRTYRFVVTMLDGGAPSSPYVDDNVYQRASASLGYEWTLTEVEGGSESPAPTEPPEPPESPGSPPPPTEPTPVEPSPPTVSPQPGTKIIGTAHADRLIGTVQDDVIYGRGGPDRIFGLAGQDYLDGGRGADWLYGGTGGDRLRGGGGSDHLDGGPGADLVLARDGKVDSIDCGRGRDTAYVDDQDRVRACERIRGSK